MSCLNEETILGFLNGRLTPDELPRVEAHVSGCLACDELLSMAAAALRAPAPADLPPGTLLSRYTILALVGRGAMGEVYAAYDPTLDRKIAVKLLQSRAGKGGANETRLLLEAQAIARLSHANVITVYDVGTFADRVFVAMEYVDGQTLSAWLSERQRPRAEILAAFAQAGRGLAAAHAAGVIHRDFKPQNVMVARNGVVRVMDFGLARRIDTEPAAGSLDASGASVRTTVPANITRTGELLGTPLYMAPEQLRAGVTDARSDQFSFCVALYWALYDEHPFAGRPGRHDEMFAALLAGRVQPQPPRSNVPAWLRRVLLRGLAVAPEGRWPSMDDLVTALTRDPARSRRRLGLGVAAMLIAAAGLASLARPPRSAGLCGGGPARLGDVWRQVQHSPRNPDPRRAAVRAAFLASGLPNAEESWVRVAALLDRYAGDWLQMYRDACEATHVRGEQSADVLDLRMGCLDDRRAALRALTDLLATADRQTASKGVDAVIALPPLDRCADVRVLRSGVEPPGDAQTRARVEDLRKRAAQISALVGTGHAEEAEPQADALLAGARSLNYPPLEAELLLLAAAAHSVADSSPLWTTTVTLHRAATAAALRAKRDDIAAEAATGLVADTGYMQNRREEGESWAQLAEGLIDRLGPGHERLRSWLLQNQAAVELRANNLRGALRLVREARALKEKVLPVGHPDIAVSMGTEALILHELGDDEAALSLSERVCRVIGEAYGPNSANVAHVQSNHAEYLLAVGRSEEALQLFEDARVRWERHVGPDHQFLAYPLTGTGRALLALGRAKEAVAPLQRALRIREVHDPDPVERGETRFALAQALWAVGDHHRARATALAAREEYAQAPAGKHLAETVAAWLSSHGSG